MITLDYSTLALLVLTAILVGLALRPLRGAVRGALRAHRAAKRAAAPPTKRRRRRRKVKTPGIY